MGKDMGTLNAYFFISASQSLTKPFGGSYVREPGRGDSD
jgi:hypothetical protein